MRRIKYSDDSFRIRTDFPDRINPNTADMSEVTVSLVRDTGALVLAATAATMYTSTTLASSASRGDAYIVLAAGAGDLAVGDRVLIAESDDGPYEIVTCHYYDSVNKRVYGDVDLQNAHSSGSSVIGMWAYYDFDFSETDTYKINDEITAIWNTDTDDEPWKETWIISGVESGSTAFWSRFRKIYPDNYELALAGDLVETEEYVRQRLGDKFRSRGIDFERLMDTWNIQPGIILFTRFVILDRDNDSDAQNAKVEFLEWFKDLCDSPIWHDTNEDNTKGDTEVDVHTSRVSMRII